MSWTLAEFNALPGAAAERELAAANAAPRFAREVAAGRPYPSLSVLADTATDVAAGLGWDEVGQALAAHPRIGERAAGDSAEAASSRREQAAMSDADDAVRVALAEGNRAYEERFGHAFLIRAAGRTPAEMLAALRRRLELDPAAERAETTAQLTQITRLRVERLVTG
ncbi:MAG TPA: 2-oxo-4-hydroxy-4-carboxy-5-ureidoimidazoline decarboxylase [Mycobacteriales bacterium]|nr:2-oxo-4-hydroxy-4-carboxy-5-ureidoimidazoline decarboxylase [Mycobacteriales bacterium]